MKILIVCQLYYPENVTVTNIAEQLVKYGHEVDVLTGKPNYGYGYILPEYENISEENINGVNVHRVNLIPRKKTRLSIIKNYLSFWMNSKKWVKKCEKKYDVVYSMSLSPVTICSAGNLYKKLNNVKHIIHCVDLWPESVLVTHAVRKNSLMYKVLHRWSRSIYAHADKILIGSQSFADYFDKTLKLPTNNLVYVPQCSLIEESDISPYDYGEGIHILYCGNLGIIQLIPLITEAMSLVENKNIYFHIIGMGPMSDYLVNDIKERGLENNVIYHGPIAAKMAAAYFKSADALYVSLKGEGIVGKTIPNKVMMSMVFAKPIIGVLQGDGRKVLQEAGGALLADENAESIKQAIVAFSNMSEKEKSQFGTLNRMYYDNNFSLKRVSENIEKNLK